MPLFCFSWVHCHGYLSCTLVTYEVFLGKWDYMSLDIMYSRSKSKKKERKNLALCEYFRVCHTDQSCTRRMEVWIVQPTQMLPAFSHIEEPQHPATRHIWALHQMGTVTSSPASWEAAHPPHLLEIDPSSVLFYTDSLHSQVGKLFVRSLLCIQSSTVELPFFPDGHPKGCLHNGAHVESILF